MNKLSVISIVLLLLTGCISSPVIHYDSQQSLKSALFESGLPVPDRPVYGFVSRVNGIWTIHVWTDNPQGAACIINHEQRHIAGGEFVRWHTGPHAGC